jgi:hypothetical protein
VASGGTAYREGATLTNEARRRGLCAFQMKSDRLSRSAVLGGRRSCVFRHLACRIQHDGEPESERGNPSLEDISPKGY